MKSCFSCAMVSINGVACHERGCPDAWRDDLHECVECGCEFHPEHRHQRCCDDACYNAFHGLDGYEVEELGSWATQEVA